MGCGMTFDVSVGEQAERFTFDEMQAGDVFEIEGLFNLWMKTHECLAVGLVSGATRAVDADVEVRPYRCGLEGRRIYTREDYESR